AAEGVRPDVGSVLLELGALAEGCVPDRGGFVVTGGGDPAAIRAEGYVGDPGRVGFDLVKFLAGGDLPEAQRAVGGAGSEGLAVGTEGAAQHVGVVALQRAQLGAGIG